jgi:hypothetical protein
MVQVSFRDAPLKHLQMMQYATPRAERSWGYAAERHDLVKSVVSVMINVLSGRLPYALPDDAMCYAMGWEMLRILCKLKRSDKKRGQREVRSIISWFDSLTEDEVRDTMDWEELRVLCGTTRFEL